MYKLRFAFVILHSLALVEASIKWTLHSSCYRTKDGLSDDPELEIAMLKAVNTAQAWAKRGSEQLDKSKSIFLGPLIKRDLKPLISHGKYEDQVDAITAKFNKFAELEGPIGRGNPGVARYDESRNWQDLASQDTHYLDFLIVCRPSLEDRAIEGSPERLPYDRIRQVQKYTKDADLNVMLRQEETIGDWNKIEGFRLLAITDVDADANRNGDRLKVPETITFHPLWIKMQRTRKFDDWDEALFNEITRKGAATVFAAKGKARGNDNVVPADGLLQASFVQTVFHEFFHLSAFGGMKDDQGTAYGWVNNVKNQKLDNPDYFAIVATLIELLNREGKRYKIREDGTVSKK